MTLVQLLLGLQFASYHVFPYMLLLFPHALSMFHKFEWPEVIMNVRFTFLKLFVGSSLPLAKSGLLAVTWKACWHGGLQPTSPLCLCPIFSGSLNHWQFHDGVVGIFRNHLPRKCCLLLFAWPISTYHFTLGLGRTSSGSLITPFSLQHGWKIFHTSRASYTSFHHPAELSGSYNLLSVEVLSQSMVEKGHFLLNFLYLMPSKMWAL